MTRFNSISWKRIHIDQDSPKTEQEDQVEDFPPLMFIDEHQNLNREKKIDTIPTGNEMMIRDYLNKNLSFSHMPLNWITDFNVYKYHPQLLTSMYKLHRGKAWCFFTPRSRKYALGNRSDRRAGNGFWKATTAPDPIRSDEGVKIGTKRTLVYYEGKAKEKNEKKTDWIMHEYRVEDESANNVGPVPNKYAKLDDWVLCMIYERTSEKGEVKENQHEENDTESVQANEEQVPNQNQTGVVSDNAVNFNEQVLNHNTNQIPDEALSSNERRDDIVEHDPYLSNTTSLLTQNVQLSYSNTNQGSNGVNFDSSADSLNGQDDEDLDNMVTSPLSDGLHCWKTGCVYTRKVSIPEPLETVHALYTYPPQVMGMFRDSSPMQNVQNSPPQSFLFMLFLCIFYSVIIWQ